MSEAVELLGKVNETPDQATPLLAICIPTRNRREVLEECLASVLPQADALGVGVCVSDNGSSDGTWQTLEALKLQYPWIQIMRHTRDIGYRDNLTGVVLSSHAHYVWPVGDKYVLLPGVLKILVDDLVCLHPDAVVVNSLGQQVVSVGERMYSTPELCLTELGWQTVLLGSTVLPRQAFLDVLHVQPLSRDFPQVVALFSYLASLQSPRLLAAGRVFIQVGQTATDRRLGSYCAESTLTTFGRSLYDAVLSLPDVYSVDSKLKLIRRFSEHIDVLGFRHLMWLRIRGELTLRRLYEDQAPLRVAIVVSWWSAVVISVLPRSMLRLVRLVVRLLRG